MKEMSSVFNGLKVLSLSMALSLTSVADSLSCIGLYSTPLQAPLSEKFATALIHSGPHTFLPYFLNQFLAEASKPVDQKYHDLLSEIQKRGTDDPVASLGRRIETQITEISKNIDRADALLNPSALKKWTSRTKTRNSSLEELTEKIIKCRWNMEECALAIDSAAGDASQIFSKLKDTIASYRIMVAELNDIARLISSPSLSDFVGQSEATHVLSRQKETWERYIDMAESAIQARSLEVTLAITSKMQIPEVQQRLLEAVDRGMSQRIVTENKEAIEFAARLEKEKADAANQAKLEAEARAAQETAERLKIELPIKMFSILDSGANSHGKAVALLNLLTHNPSSLSQHDAIRILNSALLKNEIGQGFDGPNHSRLYTALSGYWGGYFDFSPIISYEIVHRVDKSGPYTSEIKAHLRRALARQYNQKVPKFMADMLKVQTDMEAKFKED